MWKRISCLMLALCLLVGICPLSMAAEEAASAEICALFAGGTGTESDPLLIADKYQLNSIRQYPAGHFRLLNDIEFMDEDYAEGGDFYNNGMGWVPCDLEGVLDGDSHVIRNLQIRVTPADRITRVGLFGQVTGTITDLGIVDGSISGSYLGNSSTYVGAFAGVGGTFIRCYNTATVYGEMPVTEQHWYNNCYVYVGGIVGSGDSLIDCRNSGTVSAYTSQVSSYAASYVGGIAGYCDDEISGCYNNGAVDAYSKCTNAEFSAEVAAAYAGGIVGYQYYGTVSQSANVGTVTATGYLSYGLYGSNRLSHASAGGIIGHMRGYQTNAITDCYNAGSIYADSKTHEFSGGIAGDLHGIITLIRCYNVGTINNQYEAPAGLVGGAGSHRVSDRYSSSAQLPVVTDCFYANTTATGVGVYSGDKNQAKLLGTPFATADELVALTATGYDTDTVWYVDPLDPITSLPLRWQMRTLQSIEILSKPTEPIRTVEAIQPDLTQVMLRATYADGLQNDVPLSALLVPELDVNTVGTQVLTPTWNGITANDSITVVVEARTAVSVSITTLPRLWVPLGAAAAEVSGGIIEVTYDNGAVVTLPLSDATISGFDGAVAGMQTLTVSYSGVSTTYEVEVRDVRSLWVSVNPNRTAYHVGDTFDPTGMVLRYTLQDGTTRTLPLEDATILSPELSAPGRYTVTVRYCGGETTLPIVVHEGYSQPDVLLDPATYPTISCEYAYDAYNVTPVTISYPGAHHLLLTFSEDSSTDWFYDETLEEYGNYVGTIICLENEKEGFDREFHGNDFGGTTVVVPGDSVTISMDGWGGADGGQCAFSSIVACMRYEVGTVESGLPWYSSSGGWYDVDDTDTYTYPGATELLLTFSNEMYAYGTRLCSDQCYITVLDGKGNEVYRRYGGDGGAALVEGNTFKVQYHHTGIENDDYYNYNGCGYEVVSVSSLTTTLHPAEPIPEVAPTCTDRGQTGGEQCAVCQMVITAPTSLNATGHALVRHEAQAPTCTEIGWSAYSTCDRCDYTTYREEAAIGHDYTADPLVCGHCGLTRTVELAFVSLPDKQEYNRRLEQLDVNGGRLRVAYSDGTEAYVDMTTDMVVDFDPTAFGAQTLTVVWCGATITYDVTFLSTYRPGDVNGDGKVNVRDLGALQQHLNGWSVDVTTPVGDVNNDGKVNVRDLALIQQYLNGWNVTLL